MNGSKIEKLARGAAAGVVSTVVTITGAAAQTVTVNPLGGGSGGLSGIGAAGDYTYGEIVAIVGLIGAAVFAVYAVAAKFGWVPKQGLGWIVGLTVLVAIAKPFFEGLVGALAGN